MDTWGDAIYDGGSVLKSMVKDKNTIVIEKRSWFDQNGSLIIYIMTLFVSGGVLWQNLETKPVKMLALVDKQVVYLD